MKYGEKERSHYCCVWQKSHMDLMGLNPSIWQDRPANNHLNHISSLLPIVGRNLLNFRNTTIQDPKIQYGDKYLQLLRVLRIFTNSHRYATSRVQLLRHISRSTLAVYSLLSYRLLHRRDGHGLPRSQNM